MPVRQEVRVFSDYMEHKLKLNDHKGGWEETPLPVLFDKLRGEVEELCAAMHDGSNLEIMLEAADVANFAMMIAWNALSDQNRHHYFGRRSDDAAQKDTVTGALPL